MRATGLRSQAAFVVRVALRHELPNVVVSIRGQLLSTYGQNQHTRLLQ